MLVGYSQSESFGQALRNTFDGKHPCSLCVLVQHERTGEKQAQSQPLVKKLQAVLVQNTAPVTFAVGACEYPELSVHSGLIAQRPPVPPPKV